MTAACPACAGVQQDAPTAPPEGVADHLLYLPDIHCPACLQSVERALTTLPGVLDARVNLTRKTARVHAPALADSALIEALAKAGHRAASADGAERPDDEDLVPRIGVAGFAMMNVMLLSVAVWSGAAGATESLFHLISAMIAVPAVIFSGRPFFVSAFRALSSGRLSMDVPIALAILLATGASAAAAVLGTEQHGWFDAALALTFFLLVGRYLDQTARRAARSAATHLAALEVEQAVRLNGQDEEIVKASDLVIGDLILLRPGDRAPADGQIVEGLTDLDRSALTGETTPASAAPGDAVSAGEVTLSGQITLKVTAAGADTSLARIAAAIDLAENQRTRYASLADRAARAYAPVVHVLSAAAFLGWWAIADAVRALDVAIAVLVITCPCALGLAVPAVSAISTGRLFKNGLLVKSNTALERLADIDTVVFDKTGTLTTGEPRLEGTFDPDTLALAAGLARGSRHPLSRAIVKTAEENGIAPITVEHLTERPGQGVEGRLGGQTVKLGKADWLGCEPGAGAEVWLSDGRSAPLRFGFQETLKADAEATVQTLRTAGYDVAMLSGDTPGAAARMGRTLGIEVALGGLTPADKLDWIEAKTSQGARILMVGDGLNDTAALAAAHASMAPGTALDASRNAADVVILGQGLSGVPETLANARLATRRMRQNIWLAGLYNVVSVPVALLGFATPLLAAIAMSTSSLTVTANAFRK